MRLGNRVGRKHETLLAEAGVRSDAYWEFQPGQRVFTCDGYPGSVVAVHDGPFAGNESYEVSLDHNLGGGMYRAGQLKDAPDAMGFTATTDYPELADTLMSHPDPASFKFTARSINGTEVDGHGAAPNRLRATDPNAYDAESTEGDPDPAEGESPYGDYRGAQIMQSPGGVYMPEGSRKQADLDQGTITNPEIEHGRSQRAWERHLMSAHGLTPDAIADLAKSGFGPEKAHERLHTHDYASWDVIHRPSHTHASRLMSKNRFVDPREMPPRNLEQHLLKMHNIPRDEVLGHGDEGYLQETHRQEHLRGNYSPHTHDSGVSYHYEKPEIYLTDRDRAGGHGNPDPGRVRDVSEYGAPYDIPAGDLAFWEQHRTQHDQWVDPFSNNRMLLQHTLSSRTAYADPASANSVFDQLGDDYPKAPSTGFTA